MDVVEQLATSGRGLIGPGVRAVPGRGVGGGGPGGETDLLAADVWTIGVDGTGLAKYVTGVGYYSLAVARALQERRDARVVLLRGCAVSHLENVHRFNGVTARWACLPKEVMGRSRWLEERIPFLPPGHLDIFHATESMPRRVAAGCVVATVHDLGLVRGVVQSSGTTLERARQDLARLLRGADHVLTVSAVTRADLCNEFPGLTVPVTVVHPGLIPVAAVPPRDPPARYGLFVGATNRRKNLVGLVGAVAALRASGEWPDGLTLVLAGPPGDQEEAVMGEVARLRVGEVVRRIGYVESDAELEGWIRGAEWLVLPGWYEGFGLPVLRAMTAGVPVLASDTGAIPEVTAGAAALFPPDDADRLAGLLATVASQARLRQELAARGLERSRAFSLAAFGDALMAAYGEARDRARGGGEPDRVGSGAPP